MIIMSVQRLDPVRGIASVVSVHDRRSRPGQRGRGKDGLFGVASEPCQGRRLCVLFVVICEVVIESHKLVTGRFVTGHQYHLFGEGGDSVMDGG